MQVRAILLAATLMLVPPSARGADLVIWWEEGYYPEEDQAVRQIITAFEQKSGKRVELAQYSSEEMPAKTLAAIEAGHPPDFAFGLFFSDYVGKWAFDDRLVDLSDAVGHFAGDT
jgi:multiple sugar transport system substrate-binding protein